VIALTALIAIGMVVAKSDNSVPETAPASANVAAAPVDRSPIVSPVVSAEPGEPSVPIEQLPLEQRPSKSGSEGARPKSEKPPGDKQGSTPKSTPSKPPPVASTRPAPIPPFLKSAMPPQPPPPATKSPDPFAKRR
jgi:hypothetical protein